ncbi:MAG: leucine-rich repeat domain-containing protein, partial [Oscillospiraceae bacterium]|nr:leucine-rich repeat domain-containing protein [Oscillospiraceae bacterium]
MKKIKILFASLIVLSCFFASCLPITKQISFMHSVIANAEYAKKIVTSGTCGENLTWNFKKSTGTLTISGTGAMEDWRDGRKCPWYHLHEDIKKVVLEDGITTIGDSSFYICNALESIIIPDSVTTIGNSAFYMCDALEYVTIPDSVTSIGDHTFFQCSALKSIVIPDSVTTIGEATFLNCYALKSIIISNSVTTIGKKTFAYCQSLTSITIPDSVTTIGDRVFERCYALKSVKISNWVTTIGEEAFDYCESLTSITIPESVTTIRESAFKHCKSLTSIHVDENNLHYSSQDGILFDKNKSELIKFPIKNTIIEYIIPDSVTTIGDRAFEECHDLKFVTIPDSVITIGEEAFYNCSLTTITIENPECEIYDSDYTILNMVPVTSYARRNASNSVTICGHDNSTTQAYAETYNRNFVSLETKNPITNILNKIKWQSGLFNRRSLG